MTEERFDSIDDVYERLSRDARTNPIPEDVMNVKTREGLAEARTLVDYAIQQGWTTAAALSRRTGHKGSAISAFRNDKWKGKAGTLATVASDLAKAVNQIVRERQASGTELGGFVTIRVAEAVFSLVQYAVKRRDMAVFLLPAGDGKTMALQALQQEVAGAILITVKRNRATVKSFLQLWARALRLNETGRAEDIQDRIVDCLEGSNRLILIDEAHKLSIAALDVVREIWDETCVPIAMAATPSFYQTITSRRVGTHQSELMDQFYSRVGIFRDLTTLDDPKTGQPEKLVTVGDIRKIFMRGHVRLSADGAAFLCKLGNTPGAGGLRGCRKLVQIVVDLYPDQQVTAALLNAALVTRLGVREAGFRMDSAEIHAPQPAAVKTG